MLKILARPIVEASRQLTQMERGFRDPQVTGIDDGARDFWVRHIDDLMAQLQSMEMTMTIMSAQKLRRHLLLPEVAPIQCHEYVLETRNRLSDEIDSRFLLALSRGESEMYTQAAPILGVDVDDAYPSSAYDISEAGKCLALGRATACVMHLMRSLETPLSLMYKDLAGKDPDRSAWGNLLIEIRDRVNALPAADGRKALYSEAAAHFRATKNAWRDLAMHARVRYTVDEAKEVMDACRAFMSSTAQFIRE